MKADGSLDTTFSDDGFATVNVAPGGKTGETSRGVAVQSSGKVVVAGAFEHDPTAEGDAARDTDIAITRFDATGKLDATFGTGGTTKVDLGTGLFLPPAAGSTATTTSLVGDSAYGLTVLPDDRLLVVGATPAKGEGRTDADFAALDVHRRRQARPDLRHRWRPHRRRRRRAREPPPGGRAARRQDRLLRLHPQHGDAARRASRRSSGSRPTAPSTRPSATAGSRGDVLLAAVGRGLRGRDAGRQLHHHRLRPGHRRRRRSTCIAARFTADRRPGQDLRHRRPGADRHRGGRRPGP